jgi:uncharacterized protein
VAHQCVHCSEVYGDGSEEILKGCSKCSSKFFFYISEEKLADIKKSEKTIELTASEKKQIEQDVRDIAGISGEEDAPVVLDFESVKILKPGKYLLDIGNLFNKERPLIYKLDDGKYIIDLVSQLPGVKKS